MAVPRIASILGALLLATWTAAASAAESFGPEFANNKYTTGIGPSGDQKDLDDYRGRLLAGESLSVSVTPDKRQSLQPTLALFDPDGVERDITPYDKSNAKKRIVGFKKFPIDRTGGWIVRVGGATATTRGDYTIAFKVKKAKAVKFKKQELGGATLERSHTFGGLEGGLLTLKLSWGKKDEPVELRSLTDPAGGDVPDNPAKALDAVIDKKTSKQLKKQVLATGDGDYSVTVGVLQGTARYTLTLKAVAPERPKGKKAVALPEIEDPMLVAGAEPVEGAEGLVVRFAGRNLVSTQTVYFAGVAGTVVAAAPDGRWIDVLPPAGAGTVDIAVVSLDGQADRRDDLFRYIPPMALSSATVTSGTTVAGNEIPFAGGHRVVVTGQNLDLLTEARFGGQTLTLENLVATGFAFDVPAGSAGSVDLVVEDHLGRTATIVDVVHYAGFSDRTGQRSPLGDATDDFSGFRGAVGDLDNDTRKDDFALGSYNVHTQYQLAANTPGTRTKLTRLLSHTTSDRFMDRSSGIPDTSSTADWNAFALAVGDLDGSPGDEILIAGGRPTDWAQRASGAENGFRRLRLFVNSGTGSFTDAVSKLPAPLYEPAVIADTEVTDTDDDGNTFIVTQVIKEPRFAADLATAIALGDLDGDGDLDGFLGTPRYGQQYVIADGSFVDYGQTPPYIRSTDVAYVNERNYFAATRVILNEIDKSNGLVDVTAAALPSAGTAADAPQTAFHARDIALGDIDGNGSLDAVVAWSNPASVTPKAMQTSNFSYVDLYGTRFENYVFDVTATLLTATRVLTNDGDAAFTDETATWMPPNVPGVDEFWQAHVVELADLDGDGDLDMALLHRRALAAFRNLQTPDLSRSSLRILRNDRIVSAGDPADQFVDVTASALPPFPADGNDNWRGNALRVFDVNQDGHLDLLVGTREQIEDDQPMQVPSTRLLFGNGDLTFVSGQEFLPPFATDSGEVDDLLIGDFAGGIDSVILITEAPPTNSTSGQDLRVFDWVR